MTAAEDAASFRVLLDAFFHSAPIEADGTIKLTEGTRRLIRLLSEQTYNEGKAGVVIARGIVKHLANAHGQPD